MAEGNTDIAHQVELIYNDATNICKYEHSLRPGAAQHYTSRQRHLTQAGYAGEGGCSFLSYFDQG